jgi:hypothetical protein
MNIKIGKGGSGKVNLTKGTNGKLIEKKYIDFFPANFISKVTLSGGGIGNGIYTRNSGGATRFYGPNGNFIEWADPLWRLIVISIFPPDGDSAYMSYDLMTWEEDISSKPPTGITENSIVLIFDPIFYKKDVANTFIKIIATDSDLSYVNGIYSQTVNPKKVYTKPFFVKDDDPNMSIYWDGRNRDPAQRRWHIVDSSSRNGMQDLWDKTSFDPDIHETPADVDWANPEGGQALGIYQPPVISHYTDNILTKHYELDPAFLEQIRYYQVNGIVPTTIQVNQRIIGAPFNTRKIEINNNTLSYIKASDNNDVENGKLNTFYGNRATNPPVDNKYSLLHLNANVVSSKSTLNIFIRLQRPIQHKNPNNGYIVREKRGVFCSYTSFNIGYRSPYYNIPGRPSYKGVFDNFSFVFTFGERGYSDIFLRPISFNLMTDYKFKFGEMYMLSICCDDGNLSIFINGELQTVALVPFNPLVNPSASRSISRRKTLYKNRRDQMPLAPGFYMKNGTIYPHTGTTFYAKDGYGLTYLNFGKSAVAQGRTKLGQNKTWNTKKRSRYLNNLDIGVINAYNIVLSESDIKTIYENFRYRYI